MISYRKTTFLVSFSVAILLFSCNGNGSVEKQKAVDWQNRKVSINPQDSLIHGQSYLSVYSQIYSETEHQTHNLTVTVSLRNTNIDSIYITSAKYYNTHGNLVRTYFDHPILLNSMETVEIIIAEVDKEGGTGGNFIFDWAIPSHDSMPLFEAIMISTSGQQGLSFRTEGKRIR
ncbi:MAG: DUF3124 domain-containing protein [Flavobacteriales bacterium]|nr:DUF3124 domain-containing protein [Flavobacteriales bacterium]